MPPHQIYVTFILQILLLYLETIIWNDLYLMPLLFILFSWQVKKIYEIVLMSNLEKNLWDWPAHPSSSKHNKAAVVILFICRRTVCILCVCMYWFVFLLLLLHKLWTNTGGVTYWEGCIIGLDVNCVGSTTSRASDPCFLLVLRYKRKETKVYSHRTETRTEMNANMLLLSRL